MTDEVYLCFKQSLRHGKPCHLPLHKGGEFMPFFRWLIAEKRGLLLCLKLLLKVTYMQAFSSGRRCRACEAKGACEQFKLRSCFK